jgi:hypothetical protein
MLNPTYEYAMADVRTKPKSDKGDRKEIIFWKV